MTKHYASRRAPFRAAQWTGEMTEEARDLVQGHVSNIDEQRRLFLDNGRFARAGDWICGPLLDVVGDEQFREIYEEVAASGRPLAPDDDNHEADFQELVRDLDTFLVEGLRLSHEGCPDVFRIRGGLMRRLRGLLMDHAYVAERRERARISAWISKELR